MCAAKRSHALESVRIAGGWKAGTTRRIACRASSRGHRWLVFRATTCRHRTERIGRTSLTRRALERLGYERALIWRVRRDAGRLIAIGALAGCA